MKDGRPKVHASSADGSTSLASPPAAVIAAVTGVLQRELAAHPGQLSVRERVLRVADFLLHRAVLDDLTPVRRAARADEIRLLVGDPVGPGRDVFASVERGVSSCLDGTMPQERLQRLLELLASTDLAEFGRALPPDREVAEAEAMDWLGDETPSPLSEADVESYLVGRDARAVGTKVRGVRRISGGFSKHTTLLELDRDGIQEEIVLRQIAPGRNASGLADEYSVVGFAWRNGVPAPEPLWLDSTDNPLGGSFFATRRVAGANIGDVFGPRSGATDPAPARGLARALARLHSLDLADLKATPVAPMATREGILARVTEQQEQVAAVAAVDGGIPRPLHELLFAWLVNHAPIDVDRPVLLHGDPGLHNVLILDGEIQAMLDWERARIGEAEQDLAYVRPHVTPVLPWEDFVAEYCAAGGAPPRDERLAYYAVWHDAWRFAGSYRGKGRMYAPTGVVLDAVVGLLHAPRFLLSGLRQAFGAVL